MNYAEQYRDAEDKGQTVNLSATFHKWEKEGTVIVGRYLACFPVKGMQEGTFYNHYIFETDEGRVKFFCGSVFDKEAGAAMRHGGIYAIKFLRKDKLSNKNTVNVFECVQVAPAPKTVGEV